MKLLQKPLVLFSLGLMILLVSACRDVSNNPIYQRPDWLEGKLFTQIKADDNLSVFAELVESTVWVDILDRSGYYTVFAPTNDAFKKFFEAHPEYPTGTIADLDSLTRDDIVRYHIIEDGWSKGQLRNMNEAGFTEEYSQLFSEPRAFKRQTLYRDQPKTVYAIPDLFQETIVSSELPGTSKRKVIPDTKKYVPIFFQEYFDIYDYRADDYSFYFNRDFNPSEIYYANAQIIGDEIFAENGFIYEIDEVVLPLPNMEQALQNNYEGRSYSKFLSMLYEYPRFDYNEDETKAQPGYDEGKSVDFLYEVDYPYFYIDIDNEETGYNFSTRNSSLITHPTLLAPTNAAFQKIVDGYLTVESGYPHYRKYEDVPDEIKWLIANSYMSRRITYSKEFTEGFVTGQNDSVRINLDDVADKQFCSNGVFIGLNEPFVPRAFTSVAGPIYLRPGYSVFRKAMISSGLLSELKREDKTFTLFAIDDYTLSEDSSMIIVEEEVGSYTIERLYGYNRSFEPLDQGKFRWTSALLANLLSNQICEGTIDGFAKKEFLRTMSGNFVMVNNSTNPRTVQGDRPSVYGFGGDSSISITFTPFEENTDNGAAFKVNGWNSFGSATNLFARVRIIGRTGITLDNYFVKLCKQVGIATESGFSTEYISNNDYYTAFIPGDNALQEYETEKGITLSNLGDEELKKFLLYHFVRGNLIFTDGKKSSGKYQTLRVDESSSSVLKVYSKLDLDLDYDEINILDKNGSTLVSISPDGNSNIMAYTQTVDPNAPEAPSIFTSAIVHEINTVLEYGQ